MLVTVSVVVEVVTGAAATSWVTSRKSVVMIAKIFIFGESMRRIWLKWESGYPKEGFLKDCLH